MSIDANKNGAEIARMNAVRVLVVLGIAFGYASTMPLGPGNSEYMALLGQDPSWIGIQVVFFLSGFLALRSLRRHGSPLAYLKSRFIRNFPSLAVFTLVAVMIIYPLLGAPADNPAEMVKKLGLYYFQTVSCIDPGRVLPGLLDDAKYMCLIQGAIWTFRWGLIAHLGAALGAKLGVFKSDRMVLGLAILSTLSFFVLFLVYAKTQNPILATPVIGARLAYIFLVGMAFYAYKDRLPTTRNRKLIILIGLLSFATISFTYLLWTPAIEISFTLFWAYGAFLLATSETDRLAVLDNWPNLALGLYLVNWPVAQLLLLAQPEIRSWGLIAQSLPLTVFIAYGLHIALSQKTYAWAELVSYRKYAAA